MVSQKTLIPDQTTKQSSESCLIGADFSRVLEEGEYLLVDQCTITAIDKDGESATSTVLDNDDKAVQTANAEDIGVTPKTNGMLVTRVKAGVEANSRYKITFLVVTSNGNTYEKDVYLKIDNI